MKVAFIASVTAGVVLFVAAAAGVGVLAWLNWNQRMLLNLISAAALGVAGAGFAIATQLRSQAENSRAPSLIVLDRQTGLPIPTLISIDSEAVTAPYADLTRLAVSSPGAGRPKDARTDEVLCADAGDLLTAFVLYKLAELQYAGSGARMERDGEGTWRARAALTGGAIPRPRILEARRLSDAWEALRGNRYYSACSAFADYQLLLPIGTKLDSSREGATVRLLLSKPLFFDWTVSVRQTGAAPGGYPEGVAPRAGDPLACFFVVESAIKFHRWTSENEHSQEIRAWASGLSDELLSRLPN